MKRYLLLMALLLAACGESEDKAPRAELRVDTLADLEEAVADATQAGLVDLDSNGEVVPALATSWRVSDDGRSIIFRLRDATWEDGRAITAGDVVAVYRRALAPGSKHPLRDLLAGIENAPAVLAGRRPARSLGVADPLPNIVELRLTAPQPALLQLLAHPGMAIVRRGNPPPANGAFKLEDAKARPLRLDRNPDYFDADGVALARVTLSAASDPVAAIARFRRGETDIVTGGATLGLGEARTVPGTLRLDPGWGVYGYVANMKRAPLADPRVRRALSMLLDRNAITGRLFAIPAMVAVTGLAPSTLPGDGDPPRPDWSDWLPDARLAEAQRLLAEAGFGADKPLTVEVVLPPGREHAAVLAAVAAQWAQLGVRVRAVTRSPAGFEKARARGDYDLALVERFAPADAPLFFLDPFRCGARSGPCNPEADRLLDEARATHDLSQRAQLIRRAGQLMVDDAPAIMLFAPVRWSLVDPRVSGWSSNALGAHPLARLDKLPDRR